MTDLSLADRGYPIATLPLTSGSLGLAHCPGTDQGGKHAGEPRLASDIAAARAWKAGLVVSLLASAELEALGIRGLGQAVRDAGMEWRHLPIHDFGTPDAAAMQQWQTLAPLIQGMLDIGEQVLLHCRAGLGRSGTMAALILIERGMSPEAAITTVRSVRPGAIETAAQEQWLRQQRPR